MLAFSRICEAASGRIVIDGIDISILGLRDVRKGVVVIPQVRVLSFFYPLFLFSLYFGQTNFLKQRTKPI